MNLHRLQRKRHCFSRSAEEKEATAQRLVGLPIPLARLLMAALFLVTVAALLAGKAHSQGLVGVQFQQSTYERNFDEELPVGSELLRIPAVYQDASFNLFTDGVFSLRGENLALGDEDGGDSKYFEIISGGVESGAHIGVLRTKAVLDRDLPGAQTVFTFYVVYSVTSPAVASGEALVAANLYDINDNSPVFSQEAYQVSLREDTPPGSSILDAIASDADQVETDTYVDPVTELFVTKYVVTNGLVGSYVFTGGNELGDFAIDPDSGVVSVAPGVNLDVDLVEFYNLTVQAEDGGGRTGNATVHITILDSNDNQPQILDPPSVVNITIPEDTPTGFVILEGINATDADHGLNALVRFYITSGDVTDSFSINNLTGEVIVSGELDREQGASITLTIAARDQGQPPLQDTIEIKVFLLDINDYTPQFTEESYDVFVNENSAVDTSIFRFEAKDLDEGLNGTVTYSIVNDSTTDFYIDPTSGDLFTNTSIDREEITMYHFVVQAVDNPENSTFQLSSTATVNVIVVDRNDNSPVWDNDAYLVEILESTLRPTSVFQALATDVDSGTNSEISYSFLVRDPTDPNHFSIDAITGDVRVNTNSLVVKLYEYKIRATDGGGRFSDVNISVNVHAINKKPPVFDPRQYNATLPENIAVGTLVLNVSAEDPDPGLIGRVRYRIASVFDEAGSFDVNPESGEVRVNSTLDFDSREEIFFMVEAYDGGFPEPMTDLANVTVFLTGVNDVPPTLVFPSGFQILVPENEPPEINVITLSNYTYDPDLGNGSEYVFAIAEIFDPFSTQNESFSINSTTGLIVSHRVFDRELQPDGIVVTINTTDFGTPPLTLLTNITIMIGDKNDNPPYFDRDLNTTAYEFEPNGTLVYAEFQGIDADIGINAELTYAIVDGDENRDFYVDPATGIIYSTGKLNKTEQRYYNLTIRVRDGGLPQFEAFGYAFIEVIDANDRVPVFSSPVYNVSFPESSPVGTTILTVNATDSDIGTNALFEYFLLTANNSNVTDRFAIDSVSGNISTSDTFDREVESFFTFQVIAIDKGSVPMVQTGTATVLIHIQDSNDKTPYFNASNYSATVVENTPNGTHVLSVLAYDNDAEYPNNAIRYSLTGNRSSAFHVNSSGDITISGEVDWEEGESFVMFAVATDMGNPPLSSDVMVTIYIVDVNDRAPIFVSSSLHLSVPENAEIGTEVGYVMAHDPDSSGNSSMFNFSVVEDYSSGSFKLDPESGLVTALATFDRETVDSYMLLIQARDFGTPQQARNATLVITISDRNDMDPEFESDHFSATISESLAIGSSVLTVNVSDGDIGTNAELLFSIVDISPASTFEINETTGEIYVAEDLDFEVYEVVTFIVIATDLGIPPRNDSTMVTVEITDFNDNRPVFLQNNYSDFLRENLAPGTVILRVNSTDADTENDAVTTYSLKETEGSENFGIHFQTGVLYTSAYIDREVMPSFQLIVIANNSLSKNPLCSEVDVEITMTDLNDNHPSFPLVVTFRIPEDTPLGSVVGTLEAKDGDKGPNGTISYQFIHGNEDGYFALESESGNVTLQNELDYENRTLFLIAVMATDGGLVNNSNYTNLLVQVLNTNDNPPLFASREYSVSVLGSSSKGDIVGTFTALDPDDDVLTYSISVGNDDGFFTTDMDSLVLARDLSSVAAGSVFNLTLVATDSMYEGTAVILIHVSSGAFGFHDTSYLTSVSELATPSATVTLIDLSSEAFGQSSFNAIASGNNAGHFAVDSTGKVTLDKGGLDYETQRLYQLTIVVEDAGGNEAFSILNVEVTDDNDFGPEFPSDTIFIALPETASKNKPFFTLLTTDRDGTTTNRETVYTISSSMPPGSMGTFLVDPTSGELSLSDTSSLNYEEGVRNYTLVIIAASSSDASLNSEVEVSISILNENSFTPVLPAFNPSTIQIEENSLNYTTISTAIATDGDIGSQGDITYGMFSSDHGYVDFFIDTFTGEINITEPLDWEKENSYVLRVVASDGGNPSRSAVRTLSVQVLDVNDNFPVWEQEIYSVMVQEDLPVGSVIIQVAASDLDQAFTGSGPDQNGYVTYSISSGGDVFAIDSDTGVVSVSSPLDREERSEYNLTLNATDGPGLYSNAYLHIEILDVNDVAPVFTEDVYLSPIAEDAAVGTLVVQVVAFDEDYLMENQEIAYSITEGNLDDTFVMNSTTGEVFLNATLDRESISEYVLVVVAVDMGTLPQSGLASVVVTVLDKNEHAPVFSMQAYNASVMENEDIGFTVLQVQATDLDSDLNGVISYSILNGSETGLFAINSTTGEVYVNGTIDYAFEQSQLLNNAIDQLSSSGDEGSGLFAGSGSGISGSGIGGSGSGQDMDSGQPAMVGPSGLVYVLVVEAQDNGPLNQQFSSTVNVTIFILDQNDNAPVFAQESYNSSISESTPPDSFIISVSAFDVDSGLNSEIEFSLDFGNDSEAESNFLINSTTGDVYLSPSPTLDHESTTIYNFSVVATDSGTPPLHSSVPMTITVSDSNDNRPMFLEANFNGTISEDSPINTFVVTILASDEDMGANAEIVYSIESLVRNEESCLANCSGAAFCQGGFNFNTSLLPLDPPFLVDNETGMVTLLDALDRESVEQYVLLAKATDSSQDEDMLSSSTCVLVTVLDVNDNEPVFSNALYVSSVPENLPVGELVLTVEATDTDIGLNSEIAFEIMGEEPDFYINSSSGAISTNRTFDRELQDTYNFTVIAFDLGSPKLNSTVEVVVTILDVNDSPPAFSEERYNSSIEENLPPSTFVLQVNTSDSDLGENAAVTYSIVPGDFSDYFAINQSSGAITTTMELDRESYDVYSVMVLATDGGIPSLSAAAQIFVTALDENDNAPEFTDTPYVVQVAENTLPNASLIRVSAFDSDVGDNAVIFFSIADVSPSVYINETFYLNASTGDLFLIATLDSEVSLEYNITVTANNSQAAVGLSSDATVFLKVIDINDHVPVFLQSHYMAAISESAPVGSSVVQLKATDADATESNSVLLFSVAGIQNAPLFVVNSSSGLVSLNMSLDRESEPVHVFEVMVQDNGVPILSSKANMTVVVRDSNDNPPIFEFSVYNFTIEENVEPPSIVGQVQANDSDIQNVTYLISPNQTDGSYFSIDDKTGIIFSEVSFDRESQEVFSFVAVATDGGIPVAMSTEVLVHVVILDRNDNPPLFSAEVYNTSWYENVTVGTNILTVEASDADLGNYSEFTFSIVPNNDTSFFSINSTSGEIFLDQQGFDRETQDAFQFQVLAVDSGSPSLTGTASVQIQVLDNNDNTPVLNATVYSATLLENTLVGFNILTVGASDRDIGNNAVLQYNSSMANIFPIDATTGVLTLAEALDYETTQEYNFTVTVRDSGEVMRSSSADVFIKVADLNDNPPVFDSALYTVSIPENSVLDMSVFQIPATDADSTSNGELRYSILGGNVESAFSVDEISGLISTAKYLDREILDQYTMSLQVVDQGVPQFTATASLMVQVEDVNDHVPHFDSKIYPVSVPEDLEVGSLVLQVLASDLDTGSNAELRYTIVSGDSMNAFEVSNVTGEVSLAKELDFETVQSYAISLQVQDGGDPPLTDIASLEVLVTDVNEHPPSFALDKYTVSMSVSEVPGTSVGYLASSDRDTYWQTRPSYSLQSSEPTIPFEVNALTGMLYVSDDLSVGETNLSILATDMIHTTEVEVEIIVLPLFSDFPLFQKPANTFEVPEHSPTGTAIGTVATISAAAAADISLVGASDLFEVTADGQLSLIGQLDREEAEFHVLNLRAIADSGTPLTTYSIVTISVTDVNDHTPILASPSYEVVVSELVPIGTPLLTLFGYDLDPSGVNSEFEISISEGNEGGSFELDHITGQLLVAKPLDYEFQDVYQLVAMATNQDAFPPLNSTALINIALRDENDNQPSFTSPPYRVQVVTSTPVGAKIFTLEATDPDSGTNSELFFSVTYTDVPNSFTINSTDGSIYTGVRLDTGTYMISASVADRGNPTPLSDTTTLTVDVVMDNLHAPIFSSPGGYQVSVPETLDVGSMVTLVSAYDPDGLNGTTESGVFYYFVSESSDIGSFEVSSSTGDIVLSNSLDYLQQSFYQLSVAAEDFGYPPRSTLVAVNVSIMDVNNNPPEFSQPLYNVSVSESTSVSTVILTVNATDIDALSIKYEIRTNAYTPDDDPLFAVNSSTGELSVVSPLDRETASQHVLEVAAIDSGYDTILSNSVEVVVYVLDENDAKPNFTEVEYQATVVRLSNVGQFVVDTMAFDPDTVGEDVEYSLLSDGGGGQFMVNASTGVVTVANSSIPEDAPDFYLLTVQASDGLNTDMATVSVQVVSQGSFCQGNGFCTSILPQNCSYHVFPYTQCIPFCASEEYELSPLGLLCSSLYCLDNSLFPCDATKTCLPPHLACSGKCPLNTTALCPTTDTCHVTSLNKSCDGSNETCLVGQTLVQQEDGSRYCTATNQIPPLASCSGDSGGVVYCELLSNCSLLTAPHLCQHCPQGMFYCTDTKICELSEQHCCGLEGYFCNVSGTCLPLSEQCRLPNVAPSIQSHLILLEVVDSSSYEPDSVDQYYYSSDGRMVGLLLSNTSSPAVDSQGEEVGLAIVEVSKILPSLGEWQFALCADLESDSYGGCSNVTSPWVTIAPDQVSEAGALVLPNTARLRFIRKAVELEGAVWIRAKLWDGNSDGYLSPSLDLVRSAEPHHDDTTSDTFSSTSAYSEHSILIVTLIHPLTLPPQLHAVAPLQLTSVQEDTTFYDNYGDEISALVGSIQVAVQEVLPEDSIEGFPPLSSDVVSVSSYEELLPPDMRSSYLAQVLAVNPTRTERLAAWESGQAPGVGIGLPSAMPGAEAQSGRWQVSVTGDEQEFVFLDSVLSGSNSSNDDDDGDHLLLLNTSARLRFLPAGDWCGETNISLHAWDGYVASADANVPLLGSFIAHVASLSRVDALSVLNLNRQEETASIHVKCVPDKPLVAVDTDTYLLDPIPYRITHHYRHLFTALVAMETETLRSKREDLEVYLFVVLEHNVNIVRFSPAGNGMAHMSFTVKGNALSLKEVRSGVMERQEVLTELGLEILEISLDASYGPGAGCLGDTPMPYYGTLVSSLVSNFASDADGDLLGLVVVADQSDSSVGAWQYHRGNWSSPAVPPDEGASLDSLLWVNLPSTSISTTSGFLLHGTDRLRFLPRPTYFWSNTTAPSLAVQVWDNSLNGFDSNVKEISLLGINADPYIDTTQSLHHPRGLFSDAVVSLLATRYGCDGVLNSAFVHDACCVCAGMGMGTGTGVDCAGCNGGGSDSTRDSCDVCGGNDESCLGCDFIPFSNTSHSTSCGECVSSTGVENGTLKAEETFPADSFVDCHGVCYGAALVDDCGVCSGGESGHVYNSDIDCSGVCFGSASIDNCGDCSLPDQRDENMDCTGVCGGPFRSDACGVCQLPAEDGSVVDHRDCSGTCFGSAGRDLCGVCYGGSTGLPSNTTLDTCGVCGGDGLSCIGCDGIENSGKVIDSCEVCGGNDCGCYKVLSLSPTRGPTSGGTEITITGAGFFLNDSTYTDYNPNSPNCGAPMTFPNGEQVQGTCRFISDSQQFTARAVIASQSSVTCVSPTVVDLQGTVNVNVSIEEKQSANTLKFVYDDYSTIAVTGYDPIDAELESNVTVQFTGENFINSSYVACLVYDFYLCYLDPSNVANPSAFPAIFWSKNKISCDVPTTELPCQVEIRISLDGQESGIVTGPEMGSKFTFRFSAPQVESIHFTDDLASLEIQFDRGSRLSDGLPFACDSVFTNTTTSLLGHLAVCLWTSDLQRGITITNLSAYSTLSIGSYISFQPGVIRTNSQFYSYGISDKPFSVDKEINAIPPVAVLNGPTSIPFCGDFSFSGEYSLYPGYRSLQYHWSIFTLDVLSTPGFTELLQHLGSFGEDASRVTFSSDMFHPDVEYYLQLSVVNSVGLQSEPVIAQLYKDTQVLSPRLEILGPLEREISPGESLMVEVYVNPLECGGSSVDTLPFLWQLSKVTSTRPFSTEEVDISSVTNVQSPNIYIPESALVEDSAYILTLTAGAAQMGGAQDVEASSQVSMNFSVQPFDIDARIYGGDSRQISHNETLVLDARVSNLIPGLAVEPSYSWSCSMADSGEPCYNQSEEISTPIIISKQSLVLLPASDLPPENTFRFTVFVMQGEYTSSANVSIAIASPVRSPPLVEIASFLPKGFSSSDVLTLKGLVFSLFPTETVIWQSVDLPGFSSIDLSDPSILLSEPMYSSSSVPVDEVTQANLVLQLGTLAPRETYVFRLTAANSEGSAFAQVFVTPDRPPHSAAVLVEPVSGVALETRFVLSAVGPVDSTTDTPLLYRFGIRPDPESDSDADITWLTGTLTSNSLSTVLPSGTLSDGEFILTIIVRIYDRNGGYSDASVKVNVQDKPELQSVSFYSDTLDQLSMVYESSADWVEALSELSTLMFELNKRVPGPDSQPIRDQCLKILLQATDERAIPFTQAHNELLIGLVSSISTSASLSDQADLKKALDLLEGLTQWYREETGQQVTVPMDNMGQSLSLLPLQLLSNSYGQDPTPRLLTTPTSQQLLEAWGQMYASVTPTEQRDAGASLLKGLEDIGYTLCQQSVQGENPSNFSTDLFDLWVQRRPPSGSLRLSDHIIDFGDALGDVYRAEVCQNTGVACSDTCVHLTVLKLDPLMPEGQATTLTSSARDKISMEIEGSDPLSLQIFSQVLSTSISQPFQNQFLSVSGLQMPIGVYIPFQPLPLSDSRALCIYRENGGSTGSHSEFVWAIDSTAPPAVVSIDGTDYYLCESTHLTDFAIGVLDPPVVTTPPIVTSEPPSPTEPTSTPVPIPRTSSVIPMQTPTSSPPPVSSFPVEAVIIPFLLLLALAVAVLVVVALLIWRKKKRSSKLKIAPVDEGAPSGTEEHDGPSGTGDGGEVSEKKGLLPPEESKVPMSIVQVKEDGEKSDIGVLNVLPSIRLRELRYQLSGHFNTLTNKPFYFLTRQLTEIEPATEQQQFVSLVFGDGTINLRLVASRSEVTKKQFCVCGNAAQFECSGCGSQGYCTPECQARHWTERHQRECTRLSEKRRRSEILQRRQLSFNLPGTTPLSPIEEHPSIGYGARYLERRSTVPATPVSASAPKDWKDFLSSSKQKRQSFPTVSSTATSSNLPLDFSQSGAKPSMFPAKPVTSLGQLASPQPPSGREAGTLSASGSAGIPLAPLRVPVTRQTDQLPLSPPPPPSSTTVASAVPSSRAGLGSLAAVTSTSTPVRLPPISQPKPSPAISSGTAGGVGIGGGVGGMASQQKYLASSLHLYRQQMQQVYQQPQHQPLFRQRDQTQLQGVHVPMATSSSSQPGKDFSLSIRSVTSEDFNAPTAAVGGVRAGMVDVRNEPLLESDEDDYTSTSTSSADSEGRGGGGGGGGKEGEGSRPPSLAVRRKRSSSGVRKSSQTHPTPRNKQEGDAGSPSSGDSDSASSSESDSSESSTSSDGIEGKGGRRGSSSRNRKRSAPPPLRRTSSRASTGSGSGQQEASSGQDATSGQQ